MHIHYRRAVVAGLVATAVMTFVSVVVSPMMGMPKMNPAEMLAGRMGNSIAAGWMAHFGVGVVLALIYAAVARLLPGPFAVRGALFGVAPWLVAQVAVMPMMGMGLFSGSMIMAGGSLVGHLLYGAVLGAVYGTPGPASHG